MWKFKKPFRKPPRGGWKYIIDEIPFKGKNYEDLFEQIKDYLYGIRQGHRWEEVKQMLIDYFCDNNPWLGRQHLPPPVRKDGLIGLSDARIIDAWIDNLFKSELEYSANIDIKKRCKACIDCPHNVDPIIDNDHYNRKVFQLARGDLREGVGHCTWFLHDNRVAVLLDSFKPDLSKNPPPGCWQNGI